MTQDEKKPKAIVFGKIDDPSEGSDAWFHKDVDTNPMFDFRDMKKFMKELTSKPKPKKKK